MVFLLFVCKTIYLYIVNDFGSFRIIEYFFNWLDLSLDYWNLSLKRQRFSLPKSIFLLINSYNLPRDFIIYSNFNNNMTTHFDYFNNTELKEPNISFNKKIIKFSFS
jgi:hypothetical protein